MRPLALVLVLAALPAAAQEDPDALRAAAERYVAGPGVQRTLDANLSPELVAAALRAQLGDRLDEEERAAIAAIVAEEMAAIRPALEAAMAEAAAETFTLAEIEALAAFHETEEGASILSKTSAFDAAYLEAVADDLRAATERAMARAAELADAP